MCLRISAGHSANEAVPIGISKVVVDALEFPNEAGGEPCFKVGRSAEEVADMVVKHVAGGSYKTTWRRCKSTPYPFYDYWEKQAGWDATARAALPLAALGA